jgi:hypothetical protein
VRDAYAHPLFNAAIDAATGFRTRNILCCAVSGDGGEPPIAVLQAGGGQGGGGTWGLLPAAERVEGSGWIGSGGKGGCAPAQATRTGLPGQGAASDTGAQAATHARASHSTRARARARTHTQTHTHTHTQHPPLPPGQALNKRGGADFDAADEQHLRLFSVHLGNTLAKLRFYEEAK